MNPSPIAGAVVFASLIVQAESAHAWTQPQ